MFKLKSQKGAMFGIDARVTLVILAALSSISYASYHKVSHTANVERSLVEAKTISEAIDMYHKDMNVSIFNTLTDGLSNDLKEQYAFRSLIEKTHVKSPFNARWNGPYLQSKNEEYKEKYLNSTYRLVRLADDLSTTCNDSKTNRCYVFLKFANVESNYCDGYQSLTASKGYTKVTRVDESASACSLYIKLTIDNI